MEDINEDIFNGLSALFKASYHDNVEIVEQIQYQREVQQKRINELHLAEQAEIQYQKEVEQKRINELQKAEQEQIQYQREVEQKINMEIDEQNLMKSQEKLSQLKRKIDADKQIEKKVQEENNKAKQEQIQYQREVRLNKKEFLN